MAVISPTATDLRMGDNTGIASGTSGEALNVFDVAYKRASDGKLLKVDSSAEESAKAFALIVSQADGADEKVAYIPIQNGNSVKSASALWTKGKAYSTSATAGKMADADDMGAVGKVSFLIGVAAETTVLNFYPEETGITA